MAADMPCMASRIMQFNSPQEELAFYRGHAENLESTLQETRAALEEFQESSRELEEELEKELQTTEKAYKELKARCEQYKYEGDEWKTKYTQAKHEQNMTVVQMQREIDILRATEERFRKNILELELDNDDLERTERAAISSMSDLEVKLNKAIERNVILENEIAHKDELMEQAQRLKDELNDANHELSVVRRQSTKQVDTIQELEGKLQAAERKCRDLEGQVRSLATTSGSPENAYYGSSYRLGARTRISRTSTGGPGVLPTKGNPVKMVQEMVSRVRNLEARLQSCRSLVTPLLNLPPSYSSTLPAVAQADPGNEASPIIDPGAQSPLQLSNLRARRPSEYMATDLMDHGAPAH